MRGHHFGEADLDGAATAGELRGRRGRSSQEKLILHSALLVKLLS